MKRFKLISFSVSLLTGILIVLLSCGVRAQSATWSKASSSGFNIRKSASSSVVNGKIYVIGGASQSGFVNTIDVYDPTTDSWSSPKTTGYFSPHYGHTSAVVDGKIYIIGGVIDIFTFSDSVSVFDPSANSWTTIDPGELNNFTECLYTTTIVLGSKIYVLGGAYGFSGPFVPLSTLQIFDTKTDRWSAPETTKDSLRPLFTPYSFLIDGKIYMIGHSYDTSCHCEVQIYNPEENKWSIPTVPKMHIMRAYFTADEVNGKIYVIGGANYDSNGGGFAVTLTEVFDPNLNKWDTLFTGGKFTPRFQLMSNTIGNKIFVIGGENSNANEILTFTNNDIVQESLTSNSVHIYPNPATTILNITPIEPSAPYRIVDVLGRVVLDGKMGDHGPTSVDISFLPKGIYTVLIERSDLKGAFVSAGKFSAIGK
ncbi:MAG: kelch repeat-containing protein [Ignavibacteriota bacterium]